MDKKNIRTFVITLALLAGLTAILVIFSSHSDTRTCRHTFRDPQVIAEPNSFAPGKRQSVCKKCGTIKTERIRATTELPQLYLNGDPGLIEKTSRTTMKAEYFDESTQFEMYASVRYQGHTSLGFDKRNYTVYFYRDSAVSDKYRVSLNGWNKTHKYCLKANYIDFSSARNIVCSNIWSDVVSSEKNADSTLLELEFRGSVDGYPVALFLNDEYLGLYTLNIPKDDDTYRIADGKNEALFVINSDAAASALFRSRMRGEDRKTVFDLEYVYPENAEWPYESLNELLGFVAEAADDAFAEDVGLYLDVETAIDYLITAYALGLTDNFAKNMVLLTYDGTRWIPTMYDLDTACGLTFDGSGFLNEDFCLPEKRADGTIGSGTDNLLWDRLLTTFPGLFQARYRELRGGVLKEENILARFNAFIRSVPVEVYEKECELYPDRLAPSSQEQLSQIESFLRARLKLLDAAVDAI